MSAHGSKQPQPYVSIDLQRFGFHPMSDTDFKHGDAELRSLGSYDLRMRMMESWDIGAKAVFLNDHILAVFYTVGKEAAKETALGPHLEALFFDVGNGMLLKKLEWPTRLRLGHDDLLDAEARIYPVHKGMFIVCALDKLMLYADDFSLLFEKQLRTPQWGDSRSVQVLPSGNEILLREEVSGKVTYSWFDVADFQPIPRGPEVQAGARRHSLYPARIYPNFPGHAESAKKYHVSDCPMDSMTLAQDQVLWYGTCGFNVNQGADTLWERRISDHVDGGLGNAAHSNLFGTRFVLNYAVTGRFVLDGVRLSKEGTFLVYDVPNRALVFSLDNPRVHYTGAALSPDGSKLAVLNIRVDIYRIP